MSGINNEGKCGKACPKQLVLKCKSWSRSIWPNAFETFPLDSTVFSTHNLVTSLCIRSYWCLSAFDVIRITVFTTQCPIWKKLKVRVSLPSMTTSSVDRAIFTANNKIVHISRQKWHTGHCHWLGLLVMKFDGFLQMVRWSLTNSKKTSRKINESWIKQCCAARILHTSC
jgi:hypothetical protein